MEVVAADPHYPEPVWGCVRRPYRESREGIRVLRPLLIIGRESTMAKIRQELSYVASLSLPSPVLGWPDVCVAVSPYFPLVPAMVNARLRRALWVLWLQDILPDGAQGTGLMHEGHLTAAARRLEGRVRLGLAHRGALGVLAANLRANGVAAEKISRSTTRQRA